MRSGLRRAGALLACAAALLGGAWAAFAPIRVDSREALFEIPRGTFARRMAGEPLPILPDEIHLTLELQDVLLLRNLDEVPQIFGPTLMMPGQSLRLPFRQAASYQFACLAHASGQMTISVAAHPETPWARLAWRARALWRWIRSETVG
ncbi:MAG TPA: hypothetical protein VFT98_04310 [Myxococcota bacterium]|nr:hypothetical protein [Myxococcota bacterium]